MAEWWKNLNLFKPGTDDNMGVEDSLNGNFQKIDEKLGNALTDKDQKVFNTLGDRLNEEQTSIAQAITDSQAALNREYNVVRDDLVHHTLALRGFKNGVPENTYSSLMLAKQAGYWGIKTELRLTSDKRWIIFTDSTVDRTTSGTGTVDSKTLAQLQALDAGTKVGGTFYANERILTLNQFLWYCRENNLTAYMELKATLTATDAAELLRIINEYSMAKRCAILSPNIPDLEMIRDLHKNLQVGYVTSSLSQTTIDYVKPIENSFLYVLWTEVIPEKYILALNAGIQVDAWHPSNYDDVRLAIKNGARRVVSSTIPF